MNCANKLASLDTHQACLDLEGFLNLPENMISYDLLYERLERLRSELEYGVKQEYFHHYPREMARLIHQTNIEREWRNVLQSFRSSRREIETGLDCYALDDYSGCVFHMMRIAELGLREIARERGITRVGTKKNKPLEWETWKEVSDAIRSELNVIRGKAPGPRRDNAINFYEIALDKIRLMQSLYRDPTMHFREKYERGEAYDA